MPRALAAALAALLIAVSARSAPTDGAQRLRPALPAAPAPAPDTAALADRLRAIVALIDESRARAASPGLRDEERDALAELAWAQVDEALEDPLLRERALRTPDFLQVQALLLMDDGEDGEAVAVLERLAALAPQDPETHRLLALGFMGTGLIESAVAEYRRALALGVESPAEVRAHLAYALAAGGHRAEGLAECERAIAANPDDYLGHLTRGWILGELGRHDEERRAYLAALQRERDDADLWALLAESWERAGETRLAREAWREVVRIDPSDEQAAGKLGVAGP